LVATALYGLASFPLALHYLSEERFGLWALMSTIGSYLVLIDLGMAGSVARLLVDHKDQRAGGTYGSLVKTGWVVLVVQGTLVFLLGVGLARPLSGMARIAPAFKAEFLALVVWQSASLGLSFVLRIFGNLLQAHQRLDICNYSSLAGLAANFAALWFFLAAGHGVVGLAWANMANTVVSAVVCLAGCWRFRLFPAAGAWGGVSWRQFCEIFGYGKDMFLVAVGTQLIMVSQPMIIARRLGLKEATLWAWGTRMFALVSQVVWRVNDISGPAFSEMMVRGESKRLRERYKAVVVWTASLSAVAAAGFVVCNSLFVSVWSGGKMTWPARNDLLLGIWMLVMAVLHCHNCFVLLTKRIGFMRYVYFIEGLVFVTAALMTTKWGGLPAMIACSILCSTLFSGAYGVWRISRHFQVPLREVGLHWLAPMGRLLLLLAPVAALCWWGFGWVKPPMARLACNAAIMGGVGSYLFLRHGLPGALQSELLARMPSAVHPVLRRVFRP
jgi:O-antigen/teichoic acid export membrane protein